MTGSQEEKKHDSRKRHHDGDDAGGTEPISKRKLENITTGLGSVDLEERQLPDVPAEFADDPMRMTEESHSDEQVEPIIEERPESCDGSFDSTQLGTSSASDLSIHEEIEQLVQTPPLPRSPINGQEHPRALALYDEFPRSDLEISDVSEEEVTFGTQEGIVQELDDDALFPPVPIQFHESSPSGRSTIVLSSDSIASSTQRAETPLVLDVGDGIKNPASSPSGRSTIVLSSDTSASSTQRAETPLVLEVGGIGNPASSPSGRSTIVLSSDSIASSQARDTTPMGDDDGDAMEM